MDLTETQIEAQKAADERKTAGQVNLWALAIVGGGALFGGAIAGVMFGRVAAIAVAATCVFLAALIVFHDR